MGRPEDCTREEPRKRPARRPRTHPCLLKGCEGRFRSRRARDRYCSAECRPGGAQVVALEGPPEIPGAGGGQRETQRQSRRYRERPEPPTSNPGRSTWETARVIPQNFFRSLLRPPRLLLGIRQKAAIAPPVLLFARVPARQWRGSGSVCGAGAVPSSSGGTRERPPREISLTY